MAEQIRREVIATRRQSWKWTEYWGPQITDVTDWSVTTTGGQIHLHRTSGRGHTEIAMSREVVGNVIEVLSEALRDDETPLSDIQDT